MLRLNNNIQAINVNRAMSRNERTTHARMESLSSGLRVSKASTDASGTVISEGFSAQVSVWRKTCAIPSRPTIC